RRGAIQVPWDQDVASLAMLLLTTVPIGRPDRALQDWLGGSVQPIIHPVQAGAAVYVQLVTAPSQAARSCFLGAISDCRNAPARRWCTSRCGWAAERPITAWSRPRVPRSRTALPAPRA